MANREFNKQPELAAYHSVISAYITNYQDRIRKGQNSSWSEPFHSFVGIGHDTYDNLYRSKQYDQMFSMSFGVVISYILSHEFAHHILGHITVKQPKNLEESRRNEDEEDDFSIRINWILGHHPLSITNYFMLFTMVEGGLHEGTYSPSACRLEKFLQAGISFTESEMNNGMDQINSALRQLKQGHRILKKAML